MRVDAHQHFWALERGDYGWLKPELAPLYRDFGPDDLEPLLNAHEIAGTVLVQAAPTVDETRYMLSLAEENNFVLGVVGWVDFESADAPEQIATLAQDPKLVGLRPMIQDIEQDDWMLGPHLSHAFEAMILHDLTFDALTLPRHLEHLLELLQRFPELRVVIDHASKPEIAAGAFKDWAAQMERAASETHASVKLSGLVTEATPDWSHADLKPYVDHLLDHFGPERMIWGSDWPVCTLASSYERWVKTTATLLSGLSADDMDAVMGGNARTTYKLEDIAR